jgi:hypothetical protein
MGRVTAAARAFGEHDDRGPAPYALGGHFVRGEGRLAVVALDEDGARLLRGRAEHRDAPQLGLGHEVGARQHGGQREHVEPAHVVGHQHARPAVLHRLEPVRHQPHAGQRAELAPPVLGRALVHRALALGDAEQRGHDHAQGVPDGQHGHRDGDDEGAHQSEKWS